MAQPSSPTTNLPDSTSIAVPTSVVRLSDDTTALATQDGLTVPRIRLVWVSPVDPFLAKHEVRFRKTADADWEAAPDPRKEDTRIFIWPVTDAVNYTVEIRAVNSIGVTSAWVTGTVTLLSRAREHDEP